MAGWNKDAGRKAAGKSKAPAKKISHVTVKKSANGGHIITHHHTDPMTHPDEHHTTKGDDELVGHMMDHMGTPNTGEAELAQPGQAPAASDAAAPPPAGGPAAAAGAPMSA